MRGLLGALLLVPALTTALVVPDVEIEVEEWTEVSSRPVNDRAVAMIGVTVPEASDIESPDGHDRNIQFNLEILRSEEACGFGNVTIDGQVLPQSLDGDVSSGKGLISSTNQDIVTGSWSFYCIKVNGVPDSQLMKFTMDAMGGEAVPDVGFSLLFRQAGQVSIMNIEHDLSVPDKVVANPYPETHQPADEIEFDIEAEAAELEYLWSQLREIKHLIHEKERVLAHHGHHQQAIDLRECDSLKCIARAVADHARNAAHELYGKLRGEFDEEDGDFGDFGKKHKHPKFPKFKQPKGKNDTRGPPKHDKGNHTHPPPPWKKPGHRPLPICRYPPPPSFHHGFPHGKLPGGPHEHHGPDDRPHPPHHALPPRPDFGWPGPKHDWRHDAPPPPWEQDPEFDGPHHHHEERPHEGPGHHQGRPDFEPLHHEERPEFDGPPRHHEQRPHFEELRHHRGPSDFDEDRPEHDAPDFEEHHRHQGPPDFDGPPPHHGEHPPPPPDFDGPPPHHGEHPPPDFDGPHGEHPPPPPPEFEHEHEHGGPPGPPPHDGPGGPPPHFNGFHGPDGPGPHRNGPGKALQIIKFTTIGFLFAFLILTLHRRVCTPKRRADRQARREERHRRRAYRRAAHKHIITRLLNRISGGDGEDSGEEDWEEKGERLLSDVEEGGLGGNGMREDIREMRTTAEVADEMVIADSHPHPPTNTPSLTISTPQTSITNTIPVSETEPLMSHDFELEELPAYEDSDGSEMSSVVADGFRYMPGTVYTPSHSPSGSVSDILGPDTKS